MPSEFDFFADAFCAGQLVQQFGARDELGDFLEITYAPPGGEAFALLGWIVSAVNGQEVLAGELAQIDVVETLKIVGPAKDLVEKNVLSFQRRAIVTIDGVDYHTDALGTVWGPVMVTLGLTRRPLVARQEGRRGE